MVWSGKNAVSQTAGRRRVIDGKWGALVFVITQRYLFVFVSFV